MLTSDDDDVVVTGVSKGKTVTQNGKENGKQNGKHVEEEEDDEEEEYAEEFGVDCTFPLSYALILTLWIDIIKSCENFSRKMMELLADFVCSSRISGVITYFLVEKRGRRYGY